MKATVKLPRMADTVDEVVVISWEVPIGATVEEGTVLLRVETDKVDADVPSPVAGILTEQLVAEGSEITTGDRIAIIETA